MDIRTSILPGFDGAGLAVHRMGPDGGQGGKPLLLLHGLFSSAQVNWIKFGHAARLAAAGFECVMPDMRAHGQSAVPRDPAAYPEDVLVKDLLALVGQLDLGAFDLCGFSLGSRTAVRAVLAGLAPQRLVLGGMGLEGLSGWAARSSHFIDAIDRFGTIKAGDPAYIAQQFMKQMNVDREAAKLLLGSIDDTPPEALAAITMPTLVVCGEQDQDNGSAPRLAQVLPNARYVAVPGTHMGSVTQAALGEAIAAFLTA